MAMTRDEAINKMSGHPKDGSEWSLLRRIRAEYAFDLIANFVPCGEPALLKLLSKEAVVVSWDDLSDAVASLVGAAAAYRTHAKRSPHLGRVPADALFTKRASDFDQSAERARIMFTVSAHEREERR